MTKPGFLYPASITPNFTLRYSSHLVTVPPGPHILSDILVASPIVRGEGGFAGAGGFEDVNPDLDPELAEVSQSISLQSSLIFFFKKLKTFSALVKVLRLSREEHERELRQRGDQTNAPTADAAPPSPSIRDADAEVGKCQH